MKDRIYLSPPHMSGEELIFVQEAFQSNWISPAGPHLDTFEKELSIYNDIKYCAALSSGTAAIHLALIMLGIGKDDEVICSSFTFAGTCNPIVYQHATPIFIDSEMQSWNMDPGLLEDAIKDRLKKGKKPKAIIPVHLYGMPAQIDCISKIAKQYEIPIIEDAAEGLGSLFKNQKLGTFGDIGIYSFNGNKIITTSGGGAIASNNAEWIQRAKFLSTQARDPAPHYEHTQIGYNYRLSNICAGIGRGQLKVIDQRVKQRRANFEHYKKRLSAVEVAFQPEAEGSYSNRWLTCILLNDKSNIRPDDLRLSLESENIESRPLWKPMHRQPVFKDAPFYGSGISDKLFSQGLCLPSGSNMSEDQLNRVVDIISPLLSKG